MTAAGSSLLWVRPGSGTSGSEEHLVSLIAVVVQVMIVRTRVIMFPIVPMVNLWGLQWTTLVGTHTAL